MKLLTISCIVSLLMSLVAWSQTDNDRAKVIKHIIDTGLISGSDEQVIDGTGDVSAAIIIKLYNGAPPIKQEAIPGILKVLNHAFVGDPGTNPSLQPGKALFVLRSIEPAATDPAIKTQISQTRAHLLRYKKVPQP